MRTNTDKRQLQLIIQRATVPSILKTYHSVSHFRVDVMLVIAVTGSAELGLLRYQKQMYIHTHMLRCSGITEGRSIVCFIR